MYRRVSSTRQKRFNLDGPDGCHYYWRDLRKGPRSILSRNFGGGSVMVCAGISFLGKTPIAFISTRQNSEQYCECLRGFLIPFANEHYGSHFSFMQDNAAIHRSAFTKHWLSEQNIALINPPALSPDLNPIENCCGQLARAVYNNGRQYDTVQSLKTSIEREWGLIELDYIRTLVESMPNRLRDVLLSRGKMTEY